MLTLSPYFQSPTWSPKLLSSDIILSLSILAISRGSTGILFILSSKSRLEGEIVVIVNPLLIVLVNASDIVWSSSNQLKSMIGEPLVIWGNKSFITSSSFRLPCGLALDKAVNILKRWCSPRSKSTLLILSP